MKIKFLSFIASFFMVSFVITSCLDDDNNIEYSPDATIHAFALDTAGLGSYKFTIDQLSREIYNEDSLPVHADTIIDKILIKTLTTASGVVTMKDKSGNDSVLNINDSIDLRKELTIKVWSTEALAGISPNQTKEYKIKVNVHDYDPDSLRWKYMNKIDDQIVGEQKSIIFGSEVLTYSVVGTKLYAYKNSLTNFGSWEYKEIEGLPKGKLPTSIIAFQFNRSRTMLYATSNGDGKVYESADGEKWNAFYYRTRANVDYTHQFNKLDLNIAGNFGLSNFNFQPESVNSKQKFTSGDFHAGIHFTDETAPLRFNAETNLLMYERQHNMFNESEANTGIKETIIRTKGDVTGAIGDQQLITIALEMNNLLYNGYTKNVSTGDEYFKNYTTLLLNPYYELDNDDWKLHIGANVDLSFGFDKSFRISPDITAQYIFSDSYIVYAKATGGKQLNDFRRLESICPYGELPEANTTATLGYVQRPYDTYEQINGSIGFKASPYPGLWFNVFGGYQNLKNDLSYLGFDPSNIHSGSYLSFAQDNTDNLYLGGEISYDYKDILGISAKYTYRNWDSKTEEYLLAVKPVSEMSFNVRIHPISKSRL